MSEVFRAPHRTSPLDAVIEVPGSKSLTNRALVLAALADGPSTLRQPLQSRDTDLMIGALRALGHRIEVRADAVDVEPSTTSEAQPARVDCGLAGTVMRFVPPVAALRAADSAFDGDERARVRPMGTTISSLRALGVSVDDGGRGCLPFTVHGTGKVLGGDLTVDASASSQFVSALLLAAPRFEHGLNLRHRGPALPSMPHIDMTVRELQRRGVTVEVEEAQWRVAPGPIAGVDLPIEPDLSNAGVFIAAALVTAGRVRVRHWPQVTDQAGDQWRAIVEAFGGRATRDGDDLVVTGPERLQPVDLNLHDVGELTPVVTAVAALAPGHSRLSNIGHLRGHETDRLSALATEFNRLGGAVTEEPDALVIRAVPLHGGLFGTYHDHRMAHAAAVVGLAVADVDIENIATTSKTFPGFETLWSSWAAERS